MVVVVGYSVWLPVVDVNCRGTFALLYRSTPWQGGGVLGRPEDVVGVGCQVFGTCCVMTSEC